MIEVLLRSRRYLLLAIGLVVFSLIFLILEELATHHETMKPPPSPVTHSKDTKSPSHLLNSTELLNNSNSSKEKINSDISNMNPSNKIVTKDSTSTQSSFWKFELIMALTSCVSYFLCKRREELIYSRVIERINRQLACGV